MIATYNGAPLTKCETLEPRNGRFKARIETEERPSVRGTLKIDERSIQGTIVDSTESRGLWVSQFFAGAGGWQNPTRERIFAGPLRLSEALRSIAASVGERVSVHPAFDQEVPSFRLLRGPAVHALAGLPWYVSDDGETRVGYPREGKTWAHEDVTMIDTDADDCAAQAGVSPRPGDTATLAGTPVVFGDVTTSLAGDVAASVDGSPSLAEAIRAAVRPATIDASYTYQVASDGYTPTVQGGADYPLSIPRWFGPGVRAKLSPGAGVGIAYANGDRTRPVVVWADETAPLRYSIEALEITLGNGAEVPLAKGPAVVASLRALCTVLDAQAVPLLAAGMAPVLSSALAGVLSAVSKAVSATIDPIPTQIVKGE